MKALLCKAFGPIDTLAVEDLPAPEPKAGEVLIRVRAAGVNFPDALIVQGLYQFKPPFPFAPGSEAAGEVIAVGPGVTRVRPGQRVAAITYWGAFAEQIVVPEAHVLVMPDEMPFDQAGAMLLTYGTCWHGLVDRANLKAGESVLVLGAAGGIGVAAIEVAKALGARVIAAASSAEKLAVAREHGADDLIDYSKEDLRARLKDLVGANGVDVIVDPVGGSYAEPALRSIAWRGRFLVIGFAAGDIPRIPLNLALLKGCSIVGVFYGEFLKREPAAAQADAQAMFDAFCAGKLRPHVSAHYPLADGVKAILDVANRKALGKIVVQP